MVVFRGGWFETTRSIATTFLLLAVSCSFFFLLFTEIECVNELVSARSSSSIYQPDGIDLPTGFKCFTKNLTKTHTMHTDFCQFFVNFGACPHFRISNQILIFTRPYFHKMHNFSQQIWYAISSSISRLT